MPRTPLPTHLREHRRRRKTPHQRRNFHRITRRIQKSGLCLIFVSLVTSCSTARFYSQAIGGQLELTRKARPVAQVIADPETPTLLAQQLKIVADIRRFAKNELQLETGRSYTKYADLGRDYVVWSVFATPKYSLRPKTWRFPLIGDLSYRGHFAEADAKAEAAALEAEGYDTYIGGVGAYSTLGFFADPILNTFIDRGHASTAELIFHELAHRRLYRKGRTAFNESFANAVAQEGVRRWLRSKGSEKLIRTYENRLKRRKELLQKIAHARARLKTLYASTHDESAMAASKNRIFKNLQSEIRTLFQKWGTEAPEKYVAKFNNNARMAATSTYHDLVPFFEKLLEESGGDFVTFYEAAEIASP